MGSKFEEGYKKVTKIESDPELKRILESIPPERDRTPRGWKDSIRTIILREIETRRQTGIHILTGPAEKFNIQRIKEREKKKVQSSLPNR